MSKKYKNGVHSISNDDYHASHGVSRSSLWEFRKSPYHYWYKYVRHDYEPSAPTPSMVIGEFLHVACLEPHLLSEKIAVEPDINKRTKAGKEEYQTWLNEQQNKTILTLKQYEEAKKMFDNISNNDMFNSLISDANIEKSIYFTHEPTGIQCKVRPDAWLGSIVTDLKTTADASYRAFQMSAYKYGYFLQAGMIYKALQSLDIQLEKFVITCIENNEPYNFALYELDDESIDFGVQQFDFLMNRLAEKIESQDWFSYELQTLCVPNWANPEE